ncbi:MAG: T9SS type A sorting domain-containing protein [candidate division WOR-3 bacterium]|nr:MAG: T9SS type A sorting domain-containing protein [candidate division WOR-3 bacterium]
MNRYVSVFLLVSTIILAQETGARYLIITHDDFYNAIQPLAEWKHRMGLKTKVVKLSEIGNTTTNIRAYVDNAYDTWPIRPEFLLIVGSPYHVPFYMFSYNCYSDNYYTNMDTDIYNEILSGRLTVHNDTEARTVVNKILLYEKTPYTTDSLWFLNACLIANEEGYTYPPPYWSDDSIYWDDVRYAKGYMLANGYHTIDTLSKLLGNNYNTVINRVNQGRAFILYRGCGTNNWYYPFAVDANQTQNGAMLPVVLSITCGTLGTGYTSAAAEKWLLTGTPTTPRGAAGYFATTTSGSGIAHLRSAVAKGFFHAVFEQHKQTFGEACEGARLNVYSMYNSSSEYRGFTTCGDPAMRLWTAVPKPLDVLHDSAMSIEQDSLVITVLFQDEPLESALVCVLLDTTVYEYGYTPDDGQIKFNFSQYPLNHGYMQVTVTARNKIPYIDSISVGLTSVEEGAVRAASAIPAIYAYPNPFTKLTNIRYSILDTGYWIENPTLRIYDASGRLVRSLFDLSSAVGHQSSVKWDGADNTGRRLPAGVYFMQVGSGSEERSVPVILLD